MPPTATATALPANIAVEPAELRHFSGAQRAAALLLALGKDHGAALWEQLTREEVRQLSATMASLGSVPAVVVEHLIRRFAGELSGLSSTHGSVETTERLLRDVLPDPVVQDVLSDLRAPSGRSMWEKLSNVSETMFAGYLRHEHPQTAAVILSRLKTDHAARVLAALPRAFAVDVIQRMLRADTIESDILGEIEATLQQEFMTNVSRTQRRDPHEAMAELFNALDRATEEAMLGALDQRAPEEASRIRSLMFTFADLANLLPAAIATLVKQADKKVLALALKGADESMRELFLSTLTERAGKMMRDDMAAMGPVRVRECEEAQNELVRLAKSLADRGEIILVDPKNDETLIF